MMNLMTKGYIAAQVNAQKFLKDNRGSIIEYVMIIALAGILITAARGPLSTLVTNLVTAAETAVTATSGSASVPGG
ncbi:TPA: pilus assembly protein [Yersinia enterocolitica]